MERKITLFIIALFALLPIAGCQGGGSASAEQAAVKQIIERVAIDSDEVIDPSTVEVLQSQVFEENTYVVLSYQRIWNQQDQKCLSMMETHFELLRGWVAGSGGGACSDRDPDNGLPDLPIHASSAIHSRKDQNKPDISTVLARINDPQIHAVRIVWEDGQFQDAQVVKGSVFAIRSGHENLISIDVIN